MKKYFLLPIFILLGLLMLKHWLWKSNVTIMEYNEDSLSTYFHQHHLGAENIKDGIQSGVITVFPKTKTYSQKIIKESHSDIKSKSNSFGNIYTQKEIEALVPILEKLYLFFPEEMTVHLDQRPDWIKKLPFFILNPLIKSGYYVPLCAEISEISNRYLDEKSSLSFQNDIIYFEDPEHVINMLSFSNGNKQYVFGIDFQNGWIGPIDKKENRLLTTTELKERVQNNDFKDLDLIFLDSTVLINKKTFIPKEYPKNLFPDDRDSLYIYKTPLINIYPAYRKTYATHYYLWFYKNLIDRERFIKDLSVKLTKKIT